MIRFVKRPKAKSGTRSHENSLEYTVLKEADLLSRESQTSVLCQFFSKDEI